MKVSFTHKEGGGSSVTLVHLMMQICIETPDYFMFGQDLVLARVCTPSGTFC